jgi:hypothetical protein
MPRFSSVEPPSMVVARGAGLRAHDRAFGAGQRVEQARLAGVRRADDGHAEARPQGAVMLRGTGVSGKF